MRSALGICSNALSKAKGIDKETIKGYKVRSGQ